MGKYTKSPQPIVIPRNPKNVQKKIPRHQVDEVWPIILQAITLTPKIGNRELFKRFGVSCGCRTESSFSALANERGLIAFRKAAKNKDSKPKETSRQLTEDHIERFKKERESKGIIYLGRMDELVVKNLGMVEGQAKRLEESDDDTLDEKLPVHLSNMKNLHVIASSIYGLDAQKTHEDLAKMQIAILAGFDPNKARKAKGKVIDVDPTQLT